MKQKIVIKVAMCDDKSRKRAREIAVSVPGVVSLELQGAEKNEIVVTGEGIDAADLSKLIRKKVGFTDLVSVTPIPEIKPPPPPPPPPPQPQPPLPPVWPVCPHCTPRFFYADEVPHHKPDNCTIL